MDNFLRLISSDSKKRKSNKLPVRSNNKNVRVTEIKTGKTAPPVLPLPVFPPPPELTLPELPSLTGGYALDQLMELDSVQVRGLLFFLLF